jgi:squalene-hopene/tetraprenyl-beta-curcumene cyclase
MIEPTAGTPLAFDQVEAALDRAARYLLSLQHADGYWWGELEANVTMAAEHLLLERFLGIDTPAREAKIARYIRDRQQPDGGWPIYHGGPSDLSIAVEAYFAMKVAGLSPDGPELSRAREFIRGQGGAGKARIFTKLWLALFGQFDWGALPAMPPEAIVLPPRSPLNIYEFASWARATIVPILVVSAKRPVCRLPNGLGVAELFLHPEDRRSSGLRRDDSWFSWRNAFLALDRVLWLHERSPWQPLRRRALKACERWIIEHQEADGSWGGIQPPWVYSLIALKCLGYSNDHPVMAKGIAGLEGFAVETETTFTFQPCVSPVWDTALAVTGLREAGLPADHPALLKAGRWLLGKEVRQRGDWSVKTPYASPGGWPFEFANDTYPDTDDTAEVLIALRLLDLEDESRPAVARAGFWLRAMQSRNGGWGAFDRDNTKSFLTKLPFCDFGAVLDPPSEDVTAHIVEAFLLGEASPNDPAVRRAVDYLWRTQAADGSWFGRWGVNHVYGMGAVVPALVAAGVPPSDARLQRALRWLEAHQNIDGGWGESCRSYDDELWRGRGDSTPSQTAWALLALHAAGDPASATVQRGVSYLVETQREAGGWDEPWFTGTGFPRDFMLSYHLYRDYFPLWALGRYRRSVIGKTIHLPQSDPLA